jgi:Zn-finger nucleic acid-binding protein
MNEVYAGQFVYTRVEKDRSPRREAGFQTVFYSQARLEREHVEEIEPRLFLDAARERASKRVFFQSTVGHIVVAKLVGLEDVDSAGRGGNYLAHGLVFSVEDFERSGADPFAVFSAFPFFTSIADAYDHGDSQTGDIPCAKLSLAPADSRILDLAANWPRDDLVQLMLLAGSARELREENRALALVGSQKEIEDALQLAFHAIPNGLRRECSFDTFSSGMRLSENRCWAVGYPEDPFEPNCYAVDAHDCEFETLEIDVPPSCYGNWLAAILQTGELQKLVAQRDDAWTVCRILDGQVDGVTCSHAQDDLAEYVWKTNREQGEKRVVEVLEARIGLLLARRAAPELVRETRVALLFDRLLEGFECQGIARALHRSYIGAIDAPSGSEQEELRRFLREHDDAGLRLWLACWRSDAEEIARRLPELPEDDYEGFVRSALRTHLVRPADLVVTGCGEILVRAVVEIGLADDRGLSELAEGLIAKEEIRCLDALVPLVHQQPSRSLRHLASLLEKCDRPLPQQFVQAVNEAEKRVGRKGVPGFLRSLFGGSSGEQR